MYENPKKMAPLHQSRQGMHGEDIEEKIWILFSPLQLDRETPFQSDVVLPALLIISLAHRFSLCTCSTYTCGHLHVGS